MRKELLILLVLLSVFFAVGCVDNKGGSSNATGTPVTTATSATVIPGVISVSEAASFTEAFTKIASQFEKENPGTNVTINFGGSRNLRMQIEGGAPVDVFVSADENQMNILGNKSLIVNSSRKDFVHNSLVLIVPQNSTTTIANIKDLANPKIQRISIGNPDTIPVSEYSLIAFNEAGLWGQLKSKAVLAEDVKQVLVYVKRGDTDAGLVYKPMQKLHDPEL